MSKTKLTHAHIELNKEGVAKLKKTNKSMQLAEDLMKALIRECILTHAETLNIDLKMSHKDLGSWRFSVNIEKVKK